MTNFGKMPETHKLITLQYLELIYKKDPTNQAKKLPKVPKNIVNAINKMCS